MLDDDSRRTKAVRAALELARERDWGDISLSDIAQAAGLTLADLRREFTWKSDILKAFQAAVDAEVLTKVEAVRRRKGCPSRERSRAAAASQTGGFLG
jgi:AcrR family transcriptional regulator